MDHEATVRGIYDRLNAGDLAEFGSLLPDDFVEHEALPGLPQTREGVQEFFRMQLAAFPDMRMDVEDLVASGDKVVARVRFTGTHRGEFIGIPATGRSVDVQLVDIFGMGSDGRVHEHWGVMDALGLMQQIGAIPDGPPA